MQCLFQVSTDVETAHLGKLQSYVFGIIPANGAGCHVKHMTIALIALFHSPLLRYSYCRCPLLPMQILAQTFIARKLTFCNFHECFALCKIRAASNPWYCFCKAWWRFAIVREILKWYAIINNRNFWILLCSSSSKAVPFPNEWAPQFCMLIAKPWRVSRMFSHGVFRLLGIWN